MRHQRLVQGLSLALLAMALAVAFLGYLRPEFMVDLGNRIITCF